MVNSNYNPDVLNCIANLSNDEVFTPPELANRVLDLLPPELFRSPDTTFLDPFSKSGVFLREIVKRLDRGLEALMPDRQLRIDHILHNQVFGIAITELTSYLSRRSVYCSKHANGKYSVSRFNTESGNILYANRSHTWENGKCKYCGASQQVYDRGSEAEQYAYMFIHTDNPKQFFGNMKFDVIIGNPPYQLDDGGNSASAKPIYQLFVEQAIKLKPRYLSMIIPARWYSGGKGLDDFRDKMIDDTRIKTLHDYLNAAECFGNGVEIKGGVCYFLWDSSHSGPCHIFTHYKELLSESCRFLRYKDIFVRRSEAMSILDKIQIDDKNSFSTIVSSRKPFGLATSFDGHSTRKSPKDHILYKRGGTAFVSPEEIVDSYHSIDQYKIFISKAYNAGDEYPHQILNRPILVGPGDCCTETYIQIGPFKTRQEAENVISYIKTRFMRFLVSLRKISQDATSKVYQFVPIQDFSHPWTDEMLYKKYGLTENEIAFIDSMIRPME